MPTETKINKTLTTSAQITHHPEKKSFEIDVSELLQHDKDTSIKFTVNLPEDLVRQMAEYLPPPEPEIIH
jgi:uncharacterized membrane protein